MKQALIDLLTPYVTGHKIQTIEKVLHERTRHLTVVLEDLYHPHNISAALRTCDCFGIQDVYIVQHLHDYQENPNVVRGASKWLTLHKFTREEDSVEQCFEVLKTKGYRLVGTTPDRKTASIHTLDISRKSAILFGTELDGLSDFAKHHVDEMIHIPMYGFTESFNISVSVALVLQELVLRLRSVAVRWQLSEEEKTDLKLDWYKQIVRRSDLHIKNYQESIAAQNPDGSKNEH